ncbi:DUF3102 domain-containing protein [Brevibacterium permense]|uniref:DUF3102 domain-containing protein n=1 Tax=Brevibacterium permense TaxID=234834 RepID=UPI0021CE0EAA|nr:DUF3102 domain-containing protein [Brevibacterium permense]
MNEIIQAEVIRTGPEWASIIRNDLSRAVEGIVSAGQHLAQAKAEVGHGEWGPMLRGIGISQQHAHKLMQISQNEAISNHSCVSDLPRAVTALYELSRIDPDEFKQGMEDGVIHPDMTAQDAKNLGAGSGESSAFDKARKNLSAFEKNATSIADLDQWDQLINEADTTFRRIGGATYLRLKGEQ